MHIAASAALLLVVLGLTGGAWFFWDQSQPALIPAGRFPVTVGLLLATVACARSLLRNRRWPSATELSNPVVWSFGLVIIFLSDFLVRPWGFYVDPLVRGPILVGALLFFLARWIRLPVVLALWLGASLGGLMYAFNAASGGSILLMDDHAMFFFRLKLLRENFPSIPFWSPVWNAGFDARDFFATGVLNVFFLFSPIIYLLDIEQSYNWVVAILLWGFTPMCAFLASRILLGGNRNASLIAAGLSVSTSLLWYRWALKYGTLGFITSTALFPLCVALWITFLTQKRPAWLLCLAVAGCSTLMFFWSPSAIALAPMAIVALGKLPSLMRSSRHLLTLTLIFSLNLPWVAMMWRVSNVGNFIASGTVAAPANGTNMPPATESSKAEDLEEEEDHTPAAPAQDFRHRAGGLDARHAMNELHSQVNALNALILVFAVPALLALPAGTRFACSLTVTWLMFLGTFGVTLKPQLELDRMGLIAAMLLVIPVSRYLSVLFAAASRGVLPRIAATIAGSFLLVSPLPVLLIVFNQSSEKFRFQSQLVRQLTDTISDHSSGGRAFFSGCVVHDLDGAHLAPMALWGPTPLVASSFAHTLWQYTQPIPQAYLKRGDDGISDYLNLMNASLVIAHEPEWIKFFSSRPQAYREISKVGKFFIFARPGFTPNFVAEGEASNFSQTQNSITFVPRTERVVLKFRYFPFLTSSHCVLKPFQAGPEITFIELSQCPVGTPVTIRSVSPLERLLGTGGAA